MGRARITVPAMARTSGPCGRSGVDLLDLLSGGGPPAFATDEHHRITFWNRGAEEVLGRRADEVLGRPCQEVLRARDVFGNRFCYELCPIIAMVRRGEPLNACELSIPMASGETKTVAVTPLRIPGSRPDLFCLVHLLRPVEESSRLARLLVRLGAVAAPEDRPPAAEGAPGVPDSPPLTPREKEILGWVASGLQNKEVAQRLDISLATVRNHIHNLLEKLGVHSKLEAVSLAFRKGWVADIPAPPEGPRPQPRP